MHRVRITAIRKSEYADLIERYENPIDDPCCVSIGESWISIDGNRPEGLCAEAWKSIQPFAEALARGEGNFFGGWMRNPLSAMVSCNDGFRPVSFLVEAIDNNPV